MTPESQTHAVPLALMALLVLLGVAALGYLYYRKRQLQLAVEERFKVFRGEAVSLMDRLDGLRRRHETLPSTDPDFTEPMAGATLALYNAVDADLKVLWDRWLEVMELWDRAQKLVRSGSGLEIGSAEEARRLMARGGVDDLLRQSAFCKERLDRLNRGHELARESLEVAKAELGELKSSEGRGTGVLLPTDPHADQISRIESLFVRAEEAITADPIGAEDLIGRGRRALKELSQPEAQGHRLARRSAPTYSILDDLATAAEKFRAAAAGLGLTNLLGLFVRVWMIIWGLSLLAGILNLLMPLILLAVGLVLVLAGFSSIWVVIFFGIWYGLWRTRR